MNRTRLTPLAIIGILLLAPISLAQDGGLESKLGDYIESIKHVDPLVLAREGENATEAQLRLWKDQLIRQPNNAAARAQLLGHYHKKETLTPNERKDRNVLIFGVIRQQADTELAGSPYCMIDPDADSTAYHRAADMWQDQVRQKPNVLPVLRNAGDFLSVRRPADAEQIYRKAAERQPESAEWQEKLGLIYLLQAYRAESGVDRKGLAAQSLAAYRQALQLTPPADQYPLLDRLARAAYEAGDDAQAGHAARKLLDTAERRSDDPDQGYALHQAHTVLGLIALRQGDKQRALKELQAAGAAPPSEKAEQLGPSVALARELIKTGDREARTSVDAYLARLKDRWPASAAGIAAWQQTLAENEIPANWERLE